MVCDFFILAARQPQGYVSVCIGEAKLKLTLASSFQDCTTVKETQNRMEPRCTEHIVMSSAALGPRSITLLFVAASECFTTLIVAALEYLATVFVAASDF